MEADVAYALLRDLVAPWLESRRLALERDDFDDAILYATRDLTHLDADELNDRLHAWTRRQLERAAPAASAFVSFRHARPSTHDEAELDLQEKWIGLEATLRVELHRPTLTEHQIREVARLVGAFYALIDASGRPAGWRNVHEGNAE